jgi:FkbM family methyltransferase
MFNYDNYHIIYPEPYFQFLKENFILDVYRSDLLKENDLVLDLGACTGDFCILASKKVGKNGKVIAIEPDVENYKLLKLNIERNNCQNVILINLGVGGHEGEKEIHAPCDKTFISKIDTLENILKGLNIKDKINFIKMDIEGFEVEVVIKSIEIIKQANVISLEFHGTKEKVDNMLLKYGFSFKPITMSYIYKKIVKNFLLHPFISYKVCVDTITCNAGVIHKAISGFDMTKDYLLVGSYIKGR